MIKNTEFQKYLLNIEKSLRLFRTINNYFTNLEEWNEKSSLVARQEKSSMTVAIINRDLNSPVTLFDIMEQINSKEGKEFFPSAMTTMFAFQENKNDVFWVSLNDTEGTHLKFEKTVEGLQNSIERILNHLNKEN